MDKAVVLETERLVLRNFTLEDVPALEAVIGDPIAMRWYAAPFDHAGVIAWIERNLNRYQNEGHGLWAMALKSSGEFIGDCGCVLQEKEMPEPTAAHPAICISLFALASTRFSAAMVTTFM